MNHFSVLRDDVCRHSALKFLKKEVVGILYVRAYSSIVNSDKKEGIKKLRNHTPKKFGNIAA
ncbi:hypothetical protein MMJ09_17350 [Bacillus vallismortis]|nr:hypothetical protein [Bacillus vallismortis]